MSDKLNEFLIKKREQVTKDFQDITENYLNMCILLQKKFENGEKPISLYWRYYKDEENIAIEDFKNFLSSKNFKVSEWTKYMADPETHAAVIGRFIDWEI